MEKYNTMYSNMDYEIIYKNGVLTPPVDLEMDTTVDTIHSDFSRSVETTSIDSYSDGSIDDIVYLPKTTYKKKKQLDNLKFQKNYNGEFTSEFDKHSPFISMLIARRVRNGNIGLYCHIASFIPDLGIENKFTNWAFGKMAIGENSDRNRFGNTHLSTHAEMDALKRLDNLIRVKKCKKQKMDLIVIRVNKSGNLCESAPCFHCTKELSKSSVVSIKRLYFSRSDGSITCIKFTDWLENKDYHISKGWKWMSCCK
jgi:hypothetical protein